METLYKISSHIPLIQEPGKVQVISYILPYTRVYSKKNLKIYSTLNVRYKVIPKKYDSSRITNFYDSDNPEEVTFLQERFKESKFFTKGEHTSILKRFRQKFKKSKPADPFAGQVPVPAK